MKKPQYPLEQIAEIKKRRLEEAEKVLKAKKQALKIEEDKLVKVTEAAQKVHDHKQEKIKQLEEEMSEGITSDKIEIAEKYLEVVEENLKKAKKKVKDQKEQVKKAEQAVEQARQDMHKKLQDVEKIKIHRAEWEKEIKYEINKAEANQADEIGSIKHTRLKKEAKEHQKYLDRKKKRQ